MKISAVKSTLEAALDMGQTSICEWIAGVEANGKTTDIEAAFASAFNSQIADHFETEQSLNRIKTKTYYEGRATGRLDCYIPASSTAFEYKALRSPRRRAENISGSKYDIGQLTADYLRLNRAKNLSNGYIIAFLYGPLVRDAPSPGKLYRSFHNQMFIDYCVAIDNDQLPSRGIFRQAYEKLGWDAAWGSGTAPDWAIAVKVGSLGAICIDCRVSD